MQRLAIPLLMLLPVAGHVRAQASLSDLRPDQRVRVQTMDARRTVGRFVTATADTLVIVTPRPRSWERSVFGVESIRQVEVQAGRRTAAGVGVGLLVGIAVGVGGGLICAQVCEDGALAPIGGFVVGAPVGALVGALLAPSKWRVVTVRE